MIEVKHPVHEATRFFPVGYARQGEFMEPWHLGHPQPLGGLIQSLHSISDAVVLVVRTHEHNYLVIRPPSVYIRELEGFHFTNYRVFTDRDQAIMCAIMWRD